jgi:hypothetical protein
MIPVTIGIHELGDPPLFKELGPVQEGDLTHAAILQHGTVSGKTTVTFIIQMPDGKRVMAQTTARLLENVLGAVKGAEARWSQKNNNLHGLAQYD